MGVEMVADRAIGKLLRRVEGSNAEEGVFSEAEAPGEEESTFSSLAASSAYLALRSVKSANVQIRPGIAATNAALTGHIFNSFKWGAIPLAEISQYLQSNQ